MFGRRDEGSGETCAACASRAGVRARARRDAAGQHELLRFVSRLHIGWTFTPLTRQHHGRTLDDALDIKQDGGAASVTSSCWPATCASPAGKAPYSATPRSASDWSRAAERWNGSRAWSTAGWRVAWACIQPRWHRHRRIVPPQTAGVDVSHARWLTGCGRQSVRQWRALTRRGSRSPPRLGRLIPSR